jgi:hypothetical protein
MVMSLEHSPARQGARTAYTVSDLGDRAAFTVDEFCSAHRISRSKLYQMWNAGIGPRIMRIGTKVLITIEAAEAWRREREAEAAAQEPVAA